MTFFVDILPNINIFSKSANNETINNKTGCDDIQSGEPPNNNSNHDQQSVKKMVLLCVVVVIVIVTSTHPGENLDTLKRILEVFNVLTSIFQALAIWFNT